MKKKRITLEGIDRNYSFQVAVVNKQEIEQIAGKPCGATFIKNIAYFTDLSDDCIAHESLHITFEYIRKTNKEDSFSELLDNSSPSGYAGEEGITFSFSEIYTKVKNAISELSKKE